MPTQSLTRAITQSLTRKPTDPGLGGGGAAPSFAPDATFFAGASGYAYDPFDYSKAFQDSAGATPVTGNGQSLGRLTDLSGNGNHRTQATSAKKPLTAAGGYTLDDFDDGMSSAPSTAAGGAWTHLVRINIGADASAALIYGNDPNSYFAVYQSGGFLSTGNGITLTDIKVGGSATADNRGTLYTALNGGAKTMVTRMSAVDHALWASVVKVGDYVGFACGATIGREILINRDLSAGDLADAIAWIES